jgi:catechol 2,3-dioxygenase-like lactoylglutathione lyase family enzyme
LTISTIDHVNIATQDLAKTREFFVDALGFEDGPRPAFGTPGHWLYVGGHPIVHLQLAKGPVSPSRSSALNHIAFRVADLDMIAARLSARGIPYQMFQLPGTTSRQLQIEDPNGALIELRSQ